MKTIAVFAGATCLMMTAAAGASTPGSWAQLNTRVNRACIAMSDLARPTVLAHRVSTSDALGVEIRMVRGYDSRNRFHRKICVFRRSNSRTEVHDAASWFGATVRP